MSLPHTHSQLSVDPVVAQRNFEARGGQWTPMRAAVFAAIAADGVATTAYDITDAVSRALGRRVAANTVYRILDLFVAANLVNRIESRNAYMRCAHPEAREDCIFLVCGDCGATTHIDNAPIAEQVREAARATGFLPERPMIEIAGRCGNCQS